MTDGELREIHVACVACLRSQASYARAIPSVIDLHIAVARRRIVIDRADLVARALYCGLALADAP